MHELSQFVIAYIPDDGIDERAANFEFWMHLKDAEARAKFMLEHGAREVTIYEAL